MGVIARLKRRAEWRRGRYVPVMVAGDVGLNELARAARAAGLELTAKGARLVLEKRHEQK